MTVGVPKTAKSRRSIALSPTSVGLLKKVRTTQIERRLAAGALWYESGFTFTQADGKPIDPEWPTKDFGRLVREEDGLPHLTLYGLRHVSATLMLTSGVHPKVVSERLGHSGVAITLDLYSHVVPGLQEAAALSLEEQLAGGLEAAMD